MKNVMWFFGGIAVVVLLAVSCDSSAATPAQTFKEACVECHEAIDFSGEPVKELEASLTSIVNGTVKHKRKVTMTAAEITAMATFLSK